ncbi:MAG: PIN domain-containing protein [Chloroflexota bacterium]
MAAVGIVTAVLDACVLFPAPLRDTLLRAAESPPLYLPCWSQDILDELIRNLVAQQRVTPEGARRLLAAMQANFPEAMVTGYRGLIEQMTNDPKDHHVVAAAVRAHAQVIVTHNLRHFPKRALEPYEIEARSPDDFLSDFFVANPQRMVELLAGQAADLRQPTTAEQVVARLEKQVPEFAKRYREYVGTVPPQ